MSNAVWLFGAIFSTSAVGFDGQPLYYEIDWGPVTLADVRVELLDSEGVSSVTADIESRGAGALFSNFRSTLEILYTRDGTKLLNADSVWGDTLSNITVIWPASGSLPTVDFYRSEPRDYELTAVSEEVDQKYGRSFYSCFRNWSNAGEHGKMCRLLSHIRRGTKI